MHDIRNLPDTALVDMLSEQTLKLTRLFADLLAKDEYLQCKQLINALAAEIKARKNSGDNPMAITSDRFSTQE